MKAPHPPLDRTSGGRSEYGSRSQSSAPVACRQVCLRWRRRTIAKLVAARPGGELVLAAPYRHRRAVEHVSLPPAALAYARRTGARYWVVRFDAAGACYALSLDEVERRCWLRRHRDGHVEWFAPLSIFSPTPWLDWDYVEHHIDLDDAEPHGDRPAQPGLPEFCEGVRP